MDEGQLDSKKFLLLFSADFAAHALYNTSAHSSIWIWYENKKEKSIFRENVGARGGADKFTIVIVLPSTRQRNEAKALWL